MLKTSEGDYHDFYFSQMLPLVYVLGQSTLSDFMKCIVMLNQSVSHLQRQMLIYRQLRTDLHQLKLKLLYVVRFLNVNIALGKTYFIFRNWMETWLN